MIWDTIWNNRGIFFRTLAAAIGALSLVAVIILFFFEGGNIWDTISDMSWEDWGTVVRTLAAVVGSLTVILIIVFFFWRENNADRRRKDDDLDKLRLTLSTLRSGYHQLDDMITDDMTNEVVSKVVYSPDLDLTVAEIYRRFFRHRVYGRGATREQLEKFLRKNLPAIRLAIHTRVLEAFAAKLERLEADCAYVRHIYPGLYRVLQSIPAVFNEAVQDMKVSARDKKIWADVIRGLFDRRQEFDGSEEVLRAKVYRRLQHTLRQKLADDQKSIDDIRKILEMTVWAYLALDNKQLLKLSDQEKAKKLTPLPQTVDPIDALREAEETLPLVFKDEQKLRSYHRLVARIERRTEFNSSE